VAKKPPARKAPAPRAPVKGGRGRPAGLFTWIAVGLVVVVVATLVVIKVTSGTSTPAGAAGFQATDATTVKELTTIPLSVFNAVGVTSNVAAVNPPIKLKAGQPLLTGPSSTGASVPRVFYFGAEYCPFCAAERWSSIIALSRFGTWTGLGNMTSSTRTGEVYPGTPTFTFVKAKYHSTLLSFAEVEETTNQFSASLGNYTPLQTPTSWELKNFRHYDNTNFIPGITASQDYSIPYYSLGNQFLISGASYTPALLANQTRSQIATGLSDPSSPVTDAIIATANYITATLCQLTKNKPVAVCTSPGVMAAKKKLGIK